MFHNMYMPILRLTVRMPRLTGLVRMVRSDTLDTDAASEVSVLSEPLYRINLREAIHGFINRLAKRVPTSGKTFTRYYPGSLMFLTIYGSKGLLRWWFCRIIVIGLRSS
jgi:hypothetical protein